jgi:hypothetical protein
MVTSEQVYSGVVGIETVRTILALTAMEADLQVLAADISNAFLYGKNIEKTKIKAGPNFGIRISSSKVVSAAIKQRQQPSMRT